MILGNVIDEKGQGLEKATVTLVHLTGSNFKKITVTDKNGGFYLQGIPFGQHQLMVSFTGFQTLIIDSIHFRKERFDFNLNDLVLKLDSSGHSGLNEVVIYQEKPLIQSKEGNIIFNAGESALSEGSNAGELLSQVPLVTKDPTGKILVRGKEPRILVDDKPVELNLEQLQDLLESMPGSSIEKIEVMTNPPPQFANEQGGVINITTKKGSIGLSGRLSVYSGTRGQAGGNGSFNYRKRGFNLNINTGFGYNRVEGGGFSNRENTRTGKHFNNTSQYVNKNFRPNFRMNMNYDLNKFNSVNLVLQYNQNSFQHQNHTTFTNLDAGSQVIQWSKRVINTRGNNLNPNVVLSYTLKTRKVGESLKLIANLNYSNNQSTRDFYHQYFNPDQSADGDSTQKQVSHNRIAGNSLRLNYDLPMNSRKTFLSLGGFFNRSRSGINAEASYLDKANDNWQELDALTNKFRFIQSIYNIRASVKHLFGEKFSTSFGFSAEQTKIDFHLYKSADDTSNQYWSFLPFANINKNWNDNINLSFAYRRTIRRPGIRELNPTIDFSDPYNTRFGNPGLLPSLAHNFDLVVGKTRNSFYANIGIGYNMVEDIFTLVRTLKPDGKTEISYQNISNRKEVEFSTWNGYTLSRQLKINLSASYSYNMYSAFDKEVKKFRNGGSFTSNLNTNYVIRNLYTATGSFTFNRFANPQGTVRSSLSMNIGLQAKLLRKKLTATLNVIDPFIMQKSRLFTYGPDFILESSNALQTRNLRLSLGYSLSKTAKNKRS